MSKVEIKKKIEQKIAELEASLPDLKKAAEPVAPDNAIGRLSRMEAMGAQAINKKSYETAVKNLSSLKSALNQVFEDSFGICIECEEPIPVKRLLAIPESKLCVACAGSRAKI